MAQKVRPNTPPSEEKPKRGFHGYRPIVVKLERKKKNRKYSKSTRDFQVAFRRVAKITSEVADAASAGVGQFAKKSNASSRKRKDGILRDVVPNAVSGISKGLRRSTKVPALAAKLTPKRSFGQRLLDGVRFLVRRLRGR